MTAYVAAQRHLRGNLRGAKTLTQMALELGTTRAPWGGGFGGITGNSGWSSGRRSRRYGGRGSVIVSGRAGGLPMRSAAPKSKLALTFPLLDSWLVAMNLLVI